MQLSLDDGEGGVTQRRSYMQWRSRCDVTRTCLKTFCRDTATRANHSRHRWRQCIDQL